MDEDEELLFQVLDLFGYEFPTFCRVATGLTSAQQDNRYPELNEIIDAEEMDEFADEIVLAITDHCAVPESQVESKEEITLLVYVMNSISAFNGFLSERVQRSTSQRDRVAAAAMKQKLFDKITSSPALPALFRICDPTIRTGKVRCQALSLLYLIKVLGFKDSVWSLPFPKEENGDDDDSPSCSFSMKLISTMANALTQTGHCSSNAQFTCDSCKSSPWLALSSSLSLNLDSPDEMLEFLDNFDWPSILQQKETYVVKGAQEILHIDTAIFMTLHMYACKVLVQQPDSIMAKNFLREKLGPCEKLFHTALRRVIHEEIYRASANPRGSFEDMDKPIHFLLRFMHCLVPVPADRETKALVRRARDGILLRFTGSCRSVEEMTSLVDNENTKLGQMVLFQACIGSMDQWQDFHDQSEEERWQGLYDRFVVLPSSGEAMLAATVDVSARFRTACKKYKTTLQARISVRDREKCGNCSVSMSTLIAEEGASTQSDNQNELLLLCSRCKKIQYCSKGCQLEDWKKDHKKVCKKMAAESQS